MARPSRQIDQALLASGRALYAQRGSEALTVRALAEHAGVNPSLFHYHFGSKDDFLRALLQQVYEDGFGRLEAAAAQSDGPVNASALVRLRAVLIAVGYFLRQHASVVGRIWADAAQGQAVALEFLRDNAPRHIRLLVELLNEADAEGALVAQPMLRRLMLLMGTVAAPLLVAPRLQNLGLVLPLMNEGFDEAVMSDAAIEARADMALAALTKPMAPTQSVEASMNSQA